MHYVRLYADDNGESHFEEVELPTNELRSPVSPTVFQASEALPIKGGAFRRVLKENPGDDAHVAPRRQFVVMLRGQIEVETSLGEVRTFGPGDVLLAEDTTGRGHLTRNVGTEMRTYLQIPLE
jgi:hypothetical protein